jgi:hypothetical protein
MVFMLALNHEMGGLVHARAAKIPVEEKKRRLDGAFHVRERTLNALA